MRIAWDVSPLSHPRTGIGNYILGSLQGLLEAADGAHDVVAFAPTSPRGRGRIRDALAGLPVDTKTIVLPFSHAFRMGWSRARRPAAERWLGSFDVLHFTDWQVPPQRRGVRSTMIHDLVPLRFPEWVTPRTRSMHGYKYARTRECDLVFVNSEFTGRDVEELLGIPSERVRVAPPGVGRGLRPERTADAARPPVRAQPRHAGAAQEPRHARRGMAAAPRRARARGSRARPAGATRRCWTMRRS